MTDRNANRPGYKQTPVGWIPEEWECHAFTDIFDRVSMPLTPEPDRDYTEIGIRSHGKGVFHKEPVAGRALGDKRVFWCQPGTIAFNIVFAWEQAVALVSDAEIGMIASHRFPMYKGKASRADERFYLWFFKSPRGKHALGLASPGGAGRNKTLGQGELDYLRVPVPPLPEQKKIAAILSTWDEAIEQTRALIAVAKRRKTGLMQQLLTGKRRLPGFEGRWRQRRIEDVCEINPARSKDERGSATRDAMPFLKMEDVTEDGRIVGYRSVAACSASAGYTTFGEDDVLVAKITPCFENGKGCLVKGLPGPIGFGSTEFHTIRAGPEITPEMVYYVSRSRIFRQMGEAHMTGSAGQKRVPVEFLASYSIGLPGIPEQHAIAAVLTAADEEIKALEAKVAALDRQKKGLMQKLLTGEVRVSAQ
jgi:type I restriction enzyme S subunit